MKSILIFLLDLILALIVIGLAIWGEYKLLLPLMGDYLDWLIIIMLATFFGLAWLNGQIMEILFPNLGSVRTPNYHQCDSVVKNNKPISKADYTTNQLAIIYKPLGGYSREQLNEIYLLGILIHQIYYSGAGDNFTERLQRKALSIQMRFFITVFPQRNINEYFDFTENFMSKNESLCNYSVSECIERSIGILSTCNDRQIRKLQVLYKTLTSLYSEVGGGNKVALTTFSSMLDTELSSLTGEEDWRNHYAKKKAY